MEDAEKLATESSIDMALPNLPRMQSERVIAFGYAGGGLREFLMGRGGVWEEVPPGQFLNSGLMRRALVGEDMSSLTRMFPPEARLPQTPYDLALSVLKGETSTFLGGDYGQVCVGPTEIVASIRIRRRGLAMWAVKRGYRWVMEPRPPRQVRLVTPSGQPAPDIPPYWKTYAENVPFEDVRVDRVAVMAYLAPSDASLWWVEMCVLRAAGGKLVQCRAHHPFVWVGRISKRWCPVHHRRVEVLEAQYRRLSKRIPNAPRRDRQPLRTRLQEIRHQLGELGYSWAGTRRRIPKNRLLSRPRQTDKERRSRQNESVMPRRDELDEMGGLR